MKIRVKKNLPNNVRGPIVLMAKSEGKAHIYSCVPGGELDVEDKIGNKLLGEYSDILEVISYGETPTRKVVTSMEVK